VGFPPEGLEGCGVRFEAPWHAATDVRGIPRRPGACDQPATGLTMARCGAGALPTPLTRGVCRGPQAQALPVWSGLINAGEVAACRSSRDRDRALDAEGLKGRDHRGASARW
jgi:hypothetical protein